MLLTQHLLLVHLSFAHSLQYPVMTTGEGLGSRVVLHEGCSLLSGRYVVEECQGDGGMLVRRLVFLSAPNIAQTEVNIIGGKGGGGCYSYWVKDFYIYLVKGFLL